MSYFFCSDFLNLNRFVYYRKHCSDMNYFRMFQKILFNFLTNYSAQIFSEKKNFSNTQLICRKYFTKKHSKSKFQILELQLHEVYEIIIYRFFIFFF